MNHSDPLRWTGAGLLSVPTVKIKYGEAAFSYYKPHIWNKLLLLYNRG